MQSHGHINMQRPGEPHLRSSNQRPCLIGLSMQRSRTLERLRRTSEPIKDNAAHWFPLADSTNGGISDEGMA